MAHSPWLQSQATTTGSFSNLLISGDYYQSISIAVPARPLPNQKYHCPLEGRRFAVKHKLEVSGIGMTRCNRAYYDLGPEATVMAPIIQALLDQGAHLVGTLKLGSLVSMEELTEAADYMSHSTRGDMDTSLLGVAVVNAVQLLQHITGLISRSLQTVNWTNSLCLPRTVLIFSVATGSSRRPVLANSYFGIRTSHGRLSLEGTMSMFPIFDSPALLRQDINMFERILGAWTRAEPAKYGDKYVDDFIADLESVQNTKAKKISIAKQWMLKGRDGIDLPLEEYMKDTSVPSTTQSITKNHTSTQLLTGDGILQSKSHKPNMKMLCTEWLCISNGFLKTIMQVGKQHVLLVLPISKQEPDYRDVAPGPPKRLDALQPPWMAPLLGPPEVSIPGKYALHIFFQLLLTFE
ncbi:hypothetical protein VTL71DRAFT_3874 [Oculimacula yallundae]|uniref:Uncharacterized protein n=1 Tax=Oculimacula yallundae TaxID=86028 RepID=A0ABR4C490_9HELO